MDIVTKNQTIVQIAVHVRIYKKETGDLSYCIQGRTTVVCVCAHQQSEAGNQKQSSKTLYLSLHVQLMNMRFI